MNRNKSPNRPWLWVMASLVCAYGLWLIQVAARSCPAASNAAKLHDIQQSHQQLLGISAAISKAERAYAGSESPAVKLNDTDRSQQLGISAATKNAERAYARSKGPAVKLNDTQKKQQLGVSASIKNAELAYAGSEGPAVCGNDSQRSLQLPKSDALVSPLVVVAHNRVTYLARTMMILLKYWSQDPSYADKFPIYVSVDGGDPRTLMFAADFREAAGVQVISRVRDAKKCNNDDCHISLHFKMLLQLFFQCLDAPRLLFMEEDLEVAPDFFSYFEAGARLLDQDKSLWCISAWNDHGQRGRAQNNTALYRTDIIPGLGWMTNARHGKELAKMWPHAGWDHWMRRKDIRQGRQCVFPEVPRTHTFGKEGAHSGEKYDKSKFFNSYLAVMMLNNQSMEWMQRDLSYLVQDKYAQLMNSWLSAAVEYDHKQYGSLMNYCDITKATDKSDSRDMYVTYLGSQGTPDAYMNVSKSLVPMLGDLAPSYGQPRFPRGSYEGVVVVRCRGRRLFLRPLESVKGPAGTAAKSATIII